MWSHRTRKRLGWATFSLTYKVNIHLSAQHLSREDDLSKAVKHDFVKCARGAHRG